MSNLDYKPPEPTKAQLEYACYLSRFQAPRGRRTLFARTQSDIAADALGIDIAALPLSSLGSAR